MFCSPPGPGYAHVFILGQFVGWGVVPGEALVAAMEKIISNFKRFCVDIYTMVSLKCESFKPVKCVIITNLKHVLVMKHDIDLLFPQFGLIN